MTREPLPLSSYTVLVSQPTWHDDVEKWFSTLRVHRVRDHSVGLVRERVSEYWTVLTEREWQRAGERSRPEHFPIMFEVWLAGVRLDSWKIAYRGDNDHA